MEYSVWRLELIRSLLPYGVTLIGCAALTTLCGSGLLGRVRRLRLRRLTDTGTSELEFALAFPVFLAMVLITIQMALLVNATLVVDYAAFCAARSAAVWLPQDLPGEGTYSVANPDRSDSEKWSRIRGAATLATLPLSPRLTGIIRMVLPFGPPVAPSQFGGLAQLAAAGAGSGSGVNYARLALDALDKWPYAASFTDVELIDQSGASRTEFPADSVVTARVTHDFYMNVPFAGVTIGAILGRRYVSYSLGPITFGVGPYYVPVSAFYSLAVAHG